jgi:hypothetical protein
MNNHQDQQPQPTSTPNILEPIAETREAALIAALAAIILRTCVQDVIESTAQPPTERSANTA